MLDSANIRLPISYRNTTQYRLSHHLGAALTLTVASHSHLVGSHLKCRSYGDICRDFPLAEHLLQKVARILYSTINTHRALELRALGAALPLPLALAALATVHAFGMRS